jgi:hypothetical protein
MMTRHVSDHARSTSNARVLRFLTIARQGADGSLHKVWKGLHAQPATRTAAARLRQFTRIDRNHFV